MNVSENTNVRGAGWQANAPTLGRQTARECSECCSPATAPGPQRTPNAVAYFCLLSKIFWSERWLDVSLIPPVPPDVPLLSDLLSSIPYCLTFGAQYLMSALAFFRAISAALTRIRIVATLLLLLLSVG